MPMRIHHWKKVSRKKKLLVRNFVPLLCVCTALYHTRRVIEDAISIQLKLQDALSHVGDDSDAPVETTSMVQTSSFLNMVPVEQHEERTAAEESSMMMQANISPHHDNSAGGASQEEGNSKVSSDDPSTWTRVKVPDYANLVQKAQAAIRPLVEEVYKECELVLLPPPNKEATESKSSSFPHIQFRCYQNGNSNQQTAHLQDAPCSDVNLCRVVFDDLLWNFTRDPPPAWFQQDNSNNHHRQDDRNKTVLLAMMDSTTYLQTDWVMAAFLNKVSYAYMTNRDFYLFVGNPTNQEELNRRNVDTVASAFGECFCRNNDDSDATTYTNSMHYYKPIAFEALFGRVGKDIVHNILYLDADVWFNLEAFERISIGTHQHDGAVDHAGDVADTIDQPPPIALEDYFALVPNSSMMGSQNPSAKVKNILMNGGLMFLRRSEFSHTFSYLWWYLRCGNEDQIALWLVTFATWSATSHQMSIDMQRRQIGLVTAEGTSRLLANTNSSNNLHQNSTVQFGYPSHLFHNYQYARFSVTRHSQLYLPELRKQWMDWSALTKEMEKNIIIGDVTSSLLGIPAPSTHSQAFNGGAFNGAGTFTYPMELPHVLMLPLRGFTAPDGKVFPVLAQKPYKKKRYKPDGSFFVHVKSLPVETCKNQKCWPFVRTNQDSENTITRAMGGTATKSKLVEPRDSDNNTTRAIVAISMGEMAAKSKLVERFVWSARHAGEFKGPIVLLTDAPSERYKGISSWTDNFITINPPEDHHSKEYEFQTMARKRFKTYVLDYLNLDPRLDSVKLVYYLDIDIVFGSPVARLFEGLEEKYEIDRIAPGSADEPAIMWMFEGNGKGKDRGIQGGQMILDRATSRPCLDRWRWYMDQNLSLRRDQDLLRMLTEEEKKGDKSLKCKIVAMKQKDYIDFPGKRDLIEVFKAAQTSANHTSGRKYAPLVHIRNTGEVSKKTSKRYYERYVMDVLGMRSKGDDKLGIVPRHRLNYDSLN